MNTLSKITDFKDEGTDTYEWPYTDKKGRKLGCRVELSVQTFVEVKRFQEGYEHRMNVPSGTYYCFRPQAMRDGKKFGASYVWERFENPELRAIAISKYLARSEKRAKATAEKS